MGVGSNPTSDKLFCHRVGTLKVTNMDVVHIYACINARKFKFCSTMSGTLGWLQNISISETSKSVISPTGNRTPVSRVTGGDTYHYTIEDSRTNLVTRANEHYGPLIKIFSSSCHVALMLKDTSSDKSMAT